MTSPTIGQLDVEIRANFDRLVRDLERRLQAINRSQAIKLRVELQKRTLATLSKNLKSYTGFNALTSEFQKAGDAVRGMLDNIGGLSRKLSGLGALLGPLSVGVGALSQAIVALGTAAAGAAVAAPGLFLGLAASTFVFKTAFSQIPPEVQKSLDKFAEIKKTIGKNFWAEATTGVKGFLDSAVGPLNDGFGVLSTAAGNFTGKLAESFTKAFTPEVYKAFFAGVSGGFDVLANSGFGDALASISAKLAVFGAELFPRIAQGISDITIRFDEFLKANPTFLTDSFNTLVEVLKGITNTAIGLFGIFNGIAKAAAAAGIGAGSFGEGIRRVSDIVNGPAFQKGLTDFFTEAKRGMSGLGEALSPLGDLLASLAPIFGKFIGDSGVALGGFFKELFTALNQPDVLANIAKGFEGFAAVFTNLTPVAGTLAKDFGNLIGFAGTLADEFSKNLATAISVISPILDKILPSVEKLTKALGEFFRTKIVEMKPQLEQVGEAIKGLIDGVTAFVEALNTPVLKFILNLITSFITTAVSGFFNLAGGVLKVVAGLAQVLSGDFSGFSKIFEGLGGIIKGAFQLFITLFAPAKILGLVGRLVPGIGGFFTGIVTSLITRFATLINVIPGLGVRLMQALASRLSGGAAAAGSAIINGLVRGVQALIGGLLVWLTDNIWNPIKSFFGINSPSTLFMQMGQFLIEGLINGISAVIAGVAALFIVPIELIKATFLAGFEVVKTIAIVAFEFLKARFDIFVGAVRVGIEVFKAIFTGAWTIIRTTAVALFQAITGNFGAAKATIAGGVAALLGIFSGTFNNIRGIVSGVFSNVLSSFNSAKSAITGGVTAIKDKFFGAFDSILKKVTGIFKKIKDSIPKISIPGLSKLPGFATGVNNFSGGLALVGERGPEIVNLPKGSDVYTASKSRQMMNRDGTLNGGFNIGSITINEAGRAPAESLPRALRNLSFTMGVA